MKAFGLCLIGLLFTAPVSGQVKDCTVGTSSTLTGILTVTVLDGNDAVLPGIEVTVSGNMETRTMVTNGSGQSMFRLDSGTYSVESVMSNVWFAGRRAKFRIRQGSVLDLIIRPRLSYQALRRRLRRPAALRGARHLFRNHSSDPIVLCD